jgi:malate dehydrogenase (quinone)
LEHCFAERLRDEGWGAKLRAMIPSYGESLINNVELCRRVRADTAGVLNLQNVVA